MKSARELARSVEAAGRTLGLEPRRGLRWLSRMPRLLSDKRALSTQGAQSSDDFPFGKFYPCFDDAQPPILSPHYFHQDLYVAQQIFRRNPRLHVDIGSRVDGFVAHVASFRNLEVFDIRPPPTQARGIRFIQGDVMQPDTLPLEYADSVSCLHALEHFGLGRYGDPLDYNGHISGWRNIVRVAEPAATIYLSVPIGPQRIEFNAHRVFSPEYILNMAQQSQVLPERFSFIDDGGEFHEDAGLSPADVHNHYGCALGCGIFEFRKG